jgi:BirA family biotin operon repressor/biotin-[acetyl-CoA-carboxylase] ligase
MRLAGLRGEPHGSVLFAESQTAGRGQRSNKWVTPVGHDLMFSVLLRPTVPSHLWPRLTTLAALAICRGVESFLPLHPAIKWPNDVYLGFRKVAGLLAETFTGADGQSFLVLGIGLNVNSLSFPPELSGLATSLLQQTPATVQWIPREELAACILAELHKWMDCWDQSYAIALEEVRPRSLLLGQRISALVDGQRIEAKAVELTEEGHLVIETSDGLKQTLSSAVEVRLVV